METNQIPRIKTEDILARCWEASNDQDIFALSPFQLAALLEISPALYLQLFPNHDKLAEGMIDYIHRLAMQKTSTLGEASCDEKLFELTMAHFDELSPYKKATGRLMHTIMTSPSMALSLKNIALKISSTVLKASGFTTDSLLDQPRVIGYCLLGLSLFPVWIKDTSQDQSAVLRILDERLKFGQKIESFLSNY